MIALKGLKDKNYTTHSFESVIQRIKNPTQEDLKNITALRRLSKEDSNYSFYKNKLPLVFFGCTFKGDSVREEDIGGSTGYLFFDIDGYFDEGRLSSNKYIHMFWKSCGGKGWGGLIRVKNMPPVSNKALYSNILKTVGLDEVADPVCFNINRGTFIPYEPNLDKQTNNNSVVIDTSKIVCEEYSFKQDDKKQLVKGGGKTEEFHLLESAPFILLNTKVEHSLSTEWRKGEQYRYYPKGVPYHEVNLYSKIEDGKRNSTLAATAQMICYINRNSIDMSALTTIMVEINQKRCYNKLEEMEVIEISKKAYKNKHKAPKTNKKYKFLFNERLGLSHAEKNVLMGKYRVENNVEAFHEVLDNWDTNVKYSRKEAARLVGVSPNTISTWISRFPELYADAGEKIIKLKEEFYEKRDGMKKPKKKEIKQDMPCSEQTTFVEEWVDMMLADENLEIETEASWDNVNSGDYKCLSQAKWFTKNHMDSLKNNKLTKFPFYTKPNGIYEKKQEKFRKELGRDFETIVYVSEADGRRCIRMDEVYWYEDGKLVGINNMMDMLLPHTIYLDVGYDHSC